MTVPPSVLVTGGAGYIGAVLCEELRERGSAVRVLDNLLHGQERVADGLERRGVEVLRGDVRDPSARRAALASVDAVVHLAAIVGDPACARDPQAAHKVNVEGSRALVEDARELGTARLIFASTCSNYGRMADPAVPIGEDGVLAPVSLYAEQKVQIERMLLDNDHGDLRATCLRLATVYGVAPRMRFDLTINEFTRDLWAGRQLEVFGEQFWRPYVHVRDAARAVCRVLEEPADAVAGDVFNVGRSGENYRKLDLVERVREITSAGEVRFVHRDEDPRDYKVSFDKVRERLGFETLLTVPDGIREVVGHLEAGIFDDPFSRTYRNID